MALQAHWPVPWQLLPGGQSGKLVTGRPFGGGVASVVAVAIRFCPVRAAHEGHRMLLRMGHAVSGCMGSNTHVCVVGLVLTVQPSGSYTRAAAVACLVPYQDTCTTLPCPARFPVLCALVRLCS